MQMYEVLLWASSSATTWPTFIFYSMKTPRHISESSQAVSNPSKKQMRWTMTSLSGYIIQSSPFFFWFSSAFETTVKLPSDRAVMLGVLVGRCPDNALFLIWNNQCLAFPSVLRPRSFISAERSAYTTALVLPTCQLS